MKLKKRKRRSVHSKCGGIVVRRKEGILKIYECKRCGEESIVYGRKQNG